MNFYNVIAFFDLLFQKDTNKESLPMSKIAGTLHLVITVGTDKLVVK